MASDEEDGRTAVLAQTHGVFQAEVSPGAAPTAFALGSGMNGYRGLGVRVYYSDHLGPSGLRQAAEAFGFDDEPEAKWLERAFDPDTLYGMPGVPVDTARYGLARNEYVHNSDKFPELVDGMIAANLVEDTGRRVDVNYLRGMPVLRVKAPLDAATLQPQRPYVPGKGCTAAGCGRSAHSACARCGAARFCSTACQKADWKARHKAACVPAEGASGPAAASAGPA